jgi:hypothetical protein
MTATTGLERNTKLNLFYEGEDFRIFSAPSFWPYCEPWEWAPYLKKTDYVCFLDWNPIRSPEHQLKINESIGDQAIFLSSSEVAHKMRKELGLNSVIFSNNAFVNEAVFTCGNNGTEDREFRAVYTARAAAFKRIGLAAIVQDLALVVNRSFASQVVKLDESYLDVPSKYINSGHLTAGQLCSIYNRSMCGLILSTTEGACFTVVEYLLSGIPVVSTRQETPNGLGGRELWLTPTNSLYCDPVKESVAAAVTELVERRLDPQEVRSECLATQILHRQVLKEKVLQPIFSRHAPGVDLDALLFGPDAWLKTNPFRHRFSAEHVNLPLGRAISLLNRD